MNTGDQHQLPLSPSNIKIDNKWTVQQMHKQLHLEKKTGKVQKRQDGDETGERESSTSGFSLVVQGIKRYRHTAASEQKTGENINRLSVVRVISNHAVQFPLSFSSRTIIMAYFITQTSTYGNLVKGLWMGTSYYHR